MKRLFLAILLCMQTIRLLGQSQDIDSLKKVLQRFEGLPDFKKDTNYLYVLNELIYEYQYSNPDTMLILAYNAKHWCKQANYQIGSIEAYRNIGIAHRIKGNYPEALKAYFEALPRAEKIKYKKGLGKLYNNIAVVYKNQSKNKEALHYHFKSLAIKKEVEDRQGIGQSLNNIALIYENQQRYEEALSFHWQSLSIKKEFNDQKGIAHSLSNIASVYEKQEKYDSALHFYLQSITIRKQIKDKKGKAYSLHGLSKVYFALQNYQQALQYAEEGLLLSQKTSLKDKVKEFHEILSQIYEALGDYKKAFLHHKKFKNYADSLNNQETEKKTIQLQTEYEYEKKITLLEGQQIQRNLKMEKELQEQRFLRNGLLVGIGSIIVFVALMVINRQRILKARNELKERNEAVMQAKEELEVQSEELQITNDSLHKANDMLRYTHIELENKNKNILSSINAAKRIQEAMLPFEKRINAIFPQNFILFLPRDIVSGDFYWCMDTGDKVVLVVADCTGHGIPGAFMSMIGINLLDDIVNSKRITSPDLILWHLHKQIHYVLNHEQTEAKEGMDAVILTFHKDYQKGFSHIEYAGAMNPLYYIKNNTFVEIKPTKKAIGGQLFKEIERNFEKHEILLDAPIMLFACTDGYQDQFGGKEGRKFTTKQLKKLFFDIHTLPCALQKEELLQKFATWRGEESQVDDIAIWGIRIE